MIRLENFGDHDVELAFFILAQNGLQSQRKGIGFDGVLKFYTLLVVFTGLSKYFGQNFVGAVTELVLDDFADRKELDEFLDHILEGRVVFIDDDFHINGTEFVVVGIA